MAARVQKVVFVYRKGAAGKGSKIMRCDQLAAICDAHGSGRYEYSTLMVPPLRSVSQMQDLVNQCRDAVVILLKGAAHNFQPDGMEALSKSARGIAIDYVDGSVADCYSPFAGLHIASSYRGFVLLTNMLRANKDPALLWMVHHHADPRFGLVSVDTQSELRAAYLGRLNNTYIPELLQDKIAVPEYGKDSDFEKVVQHMRGYNLHYCVRNIGYGFRAGRAAAKPFTKGINAAVLGANVITTADSDDAVTYLGEDYPYLSPSQSDADIFETYLYAEESFGSDTWRNALARMAGVRAMTKPAAVARQLEKALTTLLR